MRGSLPLYLLIPLFSFLTKLASSSLLDSSLLLSLDFGFGLLVPLLLKALKVSSLPNESSYLVLISYAVRVPCSSSTVMVSRSVLSSIANILESNLIGRDLSIF